MQTNQTKSVSRVFITWDRLAPEISSFLLDWLLKSKSNKRNILEMDSLLKRVHNNPNSNSNPNFVLRTLSRSYNWVDFFPHFSYLRFLFLRHILKHLAQWSVFWFVVRVCVSSYGCTREVAKLERSVWPHATETSWIKLTPRVVALSFVTFMWWLKSNQILIFESNWVWLEVTQRQTESLTYDVIGNLCFSAFHTPILISNKT